MAVLASLCPIAFHDRCEVPRIAEDASAVIAPAAIQTRPSGSLAFPRASRNWLAMSFRWPH
jgi:hypothetical protein